jgi:hypothetical protein
MLIVQLPTSVSAAITLLANELTLVAAIQEFLP